MFRTLHAKLIAIQHTEILEGQTQNLIGHNNGNLMFSTLHVKLMTIQHTEILEGQTEDLIEDNNGNLMKGLLANHIEIHLTTTIILDRQAADIVEV